MPNNLRIENFGQYNWHVNEERYPGVWLRAKAFPTAFTWPDRALAAIARIDPDARPVIVCQAAQRPEKTCHACGMVHSKVSHV